MTNSELKQILERSKVAVRNDGDDENPIYSVNYTAAAKVVIEDVPRLVSEVMKIKREMSLSRLAKQYCD